MEKKYELCQEKENQIKTPWRHVLSRVRALKDFETHGRQIKAGDLGGYVWTEDNLSQEGNCWVMGNAWITRESKVLENALVDGSGEIGCEAIIRGNALITGHSHVWGSVIEGDSVVENCTVSGPVQIRGKSTIRCRMVESGAYDKGKIYISDSDVPAGWYISAEFGTVNLYDVTLPAPPEGSEVYLRGMNVHVNSGFVDFAVMDGEVLCDDALWCNAAYGDVYAGKYPADYVAYKAPSVPEWCYRANCPEDLNRHERRIWEQGLKSQVAIMQAVDRLRAKQAVRRFMNYFATRKED